MQSIYFWRLTLIFSILFTPLMAIRDHAPFVLVTPQKTGTHFLLPLLDNLLEQQHYFDPSNNYTFKRIKSSFEKAKQENSFLAVHAQADPKFMNFFKEKKHKVIFLLRDPRDQVLSMLFRVRDGRVFDPLDMSKEFGQLTFDEQLDEVITGRRFGFSVTKGMVKNRMDWLKQDPEFVCVLRFENIIGKEGGGTVKKQQAEVRKIAKFLNLKVGEDILNESTKGIFGDAGNFRKGQIGEWKIYFKEEHEQTFKKIFGKELIETGYEKDLNW